MDGDGSDIISRIKELQQRKIDRGEVVTTSKGTFNFSYMSDERYKDSPVKGTPEKLELNRKIIEAAEKTIDSLGIENPVIVTVRLLRENDSVELIPTLGIGGKRISEAEVELVFDPENPNVSEGLEKWMLNLVPHELNHLTRRQKGQNSLNLLDVIISEGLAVYQETSDEPHSSISPWGSALDENQIASEWAKAQPLLDSTEFKMSEWFLSGGGKHPAWTGYSLGSSIIKEYFRNNPDKTMKDVVGLPSKQILKDSGYKVA